jgi:hypothetical protein
MLVRDKHSRLLDPFISYAPPPHPHTQMPLIKGYFGITTIIYEKMRSSTVRSFVNTTPLLKVIDIYICKKVT